LINPRGAREGEAWRNTSHGASNS